MILAGIDIGTNTLRLLVAETGPDSFHEIYADRKVTRLGQDLDRRGMLTPEAEDRSLKVLCDFAENIQRHAAIQTAVIGTSALRNASNAASFVEEVKKKTSLDIRIITGEEEARLTLIGVSLTLKGCGGLQSDALESALIIDIGGGSTEIIVTHPVEEPTMASLPLGAVYLTERYVQNDPPTPAEIALLRRAVKDILEQHGGMMKAGPGKTLVGTAGTITTLAAMDLRLAEYDPGKINGHILARETVNAIVRKLSASTLDERRTLPGLEAGREDIILAGAVVTQEVMEWFGFTTMLVSDWGLREGIVLDLYEKILRPVATKTPGHEGLP
jgi:exopolyphosphatase/guanosine-5'-triphosphate,3'-diphosphate pyrophosphatase